MDAGDAGLENLSLGILNVRVETGSVILTGRFSASGGGPGQNGRDTLPASSRGREGPDPQSRYRRGGARRTLWGLLVTHQGEYQRRSREDFWGVLRGVWLSPSRFFGALDPSGGLLRPAFFASLVIYLDLLLETALQAIWVREFDFALIYAPLLGLVVAVILAPLMVAGLAILVLVVLEGAPSRATFAPAFRAVGYTTAVALVLWLPYGPFLALLYGAYVATVAVKEVLNTSPRQAAAAALIPIAAIILVLIVLIGPSELYELLLNPPQS